MQRRFWTRSAFTISLLSLWAIHVFAQPQISEINPPSTNEPTLGAPVPGTPASRATTTETAPSLPFTTAAPSAPTSAESVPPILPPTESLNLDQCIELGMQYQPTLTAARASLAAAQAGKQSVDRLIIPRLLTPDLAIRREQACHGVAIAEAGLQQADAETRYSITRNFFTVQYVRSQQEVIEDVLESLDKAYKRAKKIYDTGNPNFKITDLDLRAIEIQIDVVKAKKAKTDNGFKKAEAALREAMGIRHDHKLNIVKQDLPAPNYSFKLDDLIASALANRPEMTQANAASRVTSLEVQAQNRISGWTARAFPSGGDIHAQSIPGSVFNNDYKPGGLGMEYPANISGRKADRVRRANFLHDRALAVVDKTYNLISLDVEAMYLKWQEAATEIEHYSKATKKAATLLKDIIEQSNKTPGELTSGPIIQASTIEVMVRTQLNDAKHVHALALTGLERATAGTYRVFPVPAAAKSPDKK